MDVRLVKFFGGHMHLKTLEVEQPCGTFVQVKSKGKVAVVYELSYDVAFLVGALGEEPLEEEKVRGEEDGA